MFKASNLMRQKRIRSLADVMKKNDVGYILTHEENAEIVGINPCPNDLFQEAHRLANREAGCYYDNLRGIGYIRRSATDWDSVGDKYRTKARRQSATGRKFITNIVAKTNSLSDEEQRRASREIGLLQTIESMTRRVGRQ